MLIQPKDESPYLEISQTIQSKDTYEKWKIGLSKYMTA
jgi:hypothetical protein